MAEKRVKTTATKRRNALKAESHEVMRERLSFSASLNAIRDTEDLIASMINAGEEPGSTRITAAKVLLDSKWKRIDKVLPNLKSVDKTIHGDMNHTIRWADD